MAMRNLATGCLLALLAACSTDFVSPEDERCTLYATPYEAVAITRWMIDNCESVRVVVVTASHSPQGDHAMTEGRRWM